MTRNTPAGTSEVVVTGLGAVTPLGGDIPSTWQGLLDGRSGARGLDEPWAKDLPVRIAAPAAVDPAAAFAPAQARRMDRGTQLALMAAQEAWTDAGLGSPRELDTERLSVAVSSIIGAQTLLAGHEKLLTKGWRHISPFAAPSLLPNSSAARIAIDYGAQGSAHAPVSGCASGTEAIGLAADMIRMGRADVVVAGGAEAPIHPFALGSFAAMRALSRRNEDPQGASRPFAKDRDGFVLGEGAGIMILESHAHARARGARIYGRVLGIGMSVDGHRIAQPQPEGLGAAKAISRALADADLAPQDIAHVNAHATATPAGDLAEARALRSVLGSHTDHVAVSATKSMMGHLQGGAGAVEAIATLLALHHRTAPPTLNTEAPDDEIGLNVVAGTARQLPQRPRAALSNSFGFGGHNATLAIAA
ncbi:beta-ketoacyl-[acyl-carrier-protein] synthase family protein (plasmid) [Streptomyces sp. BHT-5-2]|uniref:beta-ketoacyl-[acyl-carrier-protein] synthase family protein n=1 Tax=unclassified Streptomyces TaxID=2593676 RepID=UPI001C8DDFF1|nr:beta-ketoacyl-[acyl-carrier-protein] synthase family protein [Streptomyces sp. BHT-5-2]QZL08761.1 beta-ketoacyl-[acyl-carrier-protein] synthase family protein [Streptomyces sp. BHT-5-2]